MRLRHLAAVLGSGPLLASCLLLLDYDELKGTPVNAGGAPELPTARGGEASGGVDGEARSCGDCDDGDPCTIDTCLALPGQEPECRYAATRGLKVDGFQARLLADRHLRVDLVGGGNLFYLSALEVSGKTRRVSLYRLAEDGTELEPLGSDLPLGGAPLSNVGLALEPLAAGEATLHGFVAVEPERPGEAPQVLHLEHRNDELSSRVVGGSYRADDLTQFPRALTVGEQVIGAWIQADGTVAVHEVGPDRTRELGDPSLPATTLSLLATDEQRPAVLFTAQADGEPLGAWVQPLGGEPTRLAECVTEPGAYVSSSVTPTQLDGVWLAKVTRAGDGYVTTGGDTLVCSGVTCVADADDCEAGAAPNSLRNVAGATVHLETEPDGVVHAVWALPELGTKAEGGLEAKLSLLLTRADFDVSPVQTRDLGRLDLAKAEAGDGLAGPDWPAVAVLPGQRAAVAWIAPRPDGPGTELRVERYKLCLGEP